MKKHFLVTGGTGFLGSALVRRLVVEGHRVRVLDNQSRGDARRLADLAADIDFVTGDIRNPQTVSRACRGVDCVCHLAFVNGTRSFYERPTLVLDVGVKGMVNVIDACLEQCVPELVLASSSEVYHQPAVIPTDETAPLVIPDPHNPRFSYAGGKMISELMALNWGRDYFERVVVFRPHNVYGPGMGWGHVVPQLLQRVFERLQSSGTIELPIEGDGRQTRAFIFIDDFVDGLHTVIRQGGHLQIYHIGTTEEVAIADVVEAIGRFYGRPIRLKAGTAQAGGTNRRCPDIKKLARLGFQPRISFEEGFRRTAAWYDELLRHRDTLRPAA